LFLAHPEQERNQKKILDTVIEDNGMTKSLGIRKLDRPPYVSRSA
jgi:hypothetical protein